MARLADHKRLFLCSNCLTEQEVTPTGKSCTCPNCHVISCKDYCVEVPNGRWNDVMHPYEFMDEEEMRAADDKEIQAEFKRACEIQEAEYKATKAAYDLAHKQLDFLVEMRSRPGTAGSGK